MLLVCLFLSRTQGQSINLRFTRTLVQLSATTVVLYSTASYTRAWDVTVCVLLCMHTHSHTRTHTLMSDNVYRFLCNTSGVTAFVCFQTVWWTSTSAACPMCPTCVERTTQRGEVASKSALRSRLMFSLLPVSLQYEHTKSHSQHSYNTSAR